VIVEKNSIKCEAVFNDTHTHRYLWKRVWNKEKPLAAVLALNPSQSDNVITDTTTTLTVNNIARLEEYGGVVVINLFSQLTSKLKFRWNSDEELNEPENDVYIKKAAEECAVIILAWGRAEDTNHRIADRAAWVLEELEPYREKLYVISDGARRGLHPLTPSIRSQWILEPYQTIKAQEMNA